jgi:hypothetical protein
MNSAAWNVQTWMDRGMSIYRGGSIGSLVAPNAIEAICASQASGEWIWVFEASEGSPDFPAQHASFNER